MTKIEEFVGWLKDAFNIEREHLDGPHDVYILEHPGIFQWKSSQSISISSPISSIQEPSSSIHYKEPSPSNQRPQPLVNGIGNFSIESERSSASFEHELLKYVDELSRLQLKMSKRLENISTKNSQYDVRLRYLENLAYERSESANVESRSAHVQSGAGRNSAHQASVVDHQATKVAENALIDFQSISYCSPSTPSVTSKLNISAGVLPTPRSINSTKDNNPTCEPIYDGLLCMRFGSCRIICNSTCFSGPPLNPEIENCDLVPSCGIL